MANTQDDIYTIEKICGRRENGGRVEYLIKWQNYPSEDNTWEKVQNLPCKELIEQYDAEQKQAERPKTALKRSTAEGSNENGESSRRLTCNTESNERRLLTSASSISEVNSCSVLTPETAARRGIFGPEHEAERILGIISLDGINFFLISFKGYVQPKWVRSSVANIHIPQMVIKFYEKRLAWNLP